MRNVFGMLVGLGVVLSASSALAQQPTDPNPPAASGQASGQAGGQVSAGGDLPAPKVNTTPAGGTPAPAAAKEDKKDDGITDHEKVVGKFGVMYFGINEQPIATGGGTGANGAAPPGGVGSGSVSMPVIGMRYWLQERIGIDAGLGFALTSSATSTTTNNVTTDRDGPAILAFGLHAGLPLAFAYGKHYKFLAIPEINFGYATQTEAAQAAPPGQANSDIHRHGMRFDLGGRVGTEIQFGFIGIPELALQASVGLRWVHQNRGMSQDAIPPGIPNSSSSSSSSNTIGTTVQSDPWALFVNNISAIYYFP